MSRRNLHIVAVAVCLLMLSGCKPSVPKQYLQPDEMETLLYDYHVARGISMVEEPDDNYKQQFYFEAVLKKHGVTRAEFDSSLVYYYTRADRFITIYEHVQERLGDNAMVLGASDSEVERYMTQSLTGDTADIWEGKRQMVLMTNRPYHLAQFSQKADTAFHKGDSFLMTFDGTILAQNGSQPAIVYLAVTYENDSTITQSMTVSGHGVTTLRIPAFREKAKVIKGFVHMKQKEDDRNGDGLCMLFLSHIQLVRFHHHDMETEIPEVKADSLLTDKPDSLVNDSMRPRRHRLGEIIPITNN